MKPKPGPVSERVSEILERLNPEPGEVEVEVEVEPEETPPPPRHWQERAEDRDGD